jgi:threonine dehydrogenase-like Zn-dependent dehydrogenase
MRALCWDGEQLTLAEDRPAPDPAGLPAGWARLRVRMAGVCSTDLEILRGYMGFTGVPGHELVGEVEAVAPGGDERLLGQRVACEINFACGACPTCRRGLGRHCPTRSVLGILDQDGCFADYVAAPVVNLRAVPDEVSDRQATFTEPLAAAHEILEQVHVQPGSRALVLGDGKLGLLCALTLHAAGAEVTAIGKHPRKLAILERAGLHTRPLAEARGQLTAARDHDLVVEATGSTAGLELAMGAVRPRGTLVLKSTVADSHSLSLAPLVIDEVTVVGSRCGPFGAALSALARGAVDPEPLIDAVYPLSRGLEAIEHARRPGALKILLDPLAE